MILKNPSWQTLYPGLPAYIPLEPEQAEKLQQLTNIPGIVHQVCFNGQHSNFYMIENYQNKKKYFIKCMQEEHVKHYEQAERVAKWLQSRKINANTALELNSHNCYIYPLLEGIRLPSTHGVLKQLGTALATVHSALKEYPLQKEVVANSVRRMSLLNDIREQIAQGSLVVGPFPDYVKKLAQNKHLIFTKGAGTQVLHGDLHPGNMLLVNNAIYFFDFEDTLHSYLPLIYELALVLERMVFVCQKDVRTILSIGQSFIRAYLMNNGEYIFQDSDSYALLTLALRSLCVLTLCEIEGNKIHESEWHKFFKLAELAHKTQDVLKKILQVK